MNHEEKTTDDIEREALKHLSGEEETSPEETAHDSVDAKPEEDGTATEKPQVKTVSDMEKEIKARITSVANAKGHSAKKSGASTTVEVAKTQKRQKNKLILAIGGSAVVVALIGMVGFHLWETARTIHTEPPPVSAEKSGGISHQRRDLGKKVDPFHKEKQTQAQTQTQTQTEKLTDSGGQSQQVTQINSVSPQPSFSEPVFRRYLALETAEDALSAQSHSQTRAQEKQGDKTPASVDARDAEKPENANASEGLNQVTLIPYDPDLYLPENRPIPCALDYRFVSDLAGKIRCTITRDIYSASGHTRLIDKGTTAYGVYNAGTLRHGQGRVFIRITKLRTRQPPYLDIPMRGSQAAGELGESGSDGWIDGHWVDRFGGALMLGMIPDMTAAAANQVGKKDRNTDYTENSRQSLADIARTAFENSVNIPPTLYKNQGDIITLITGQDIDFSAIYQLELKRRKNG
ncbi:VirB10/TraB/TrbI family type IV secretion system protein [Candidatus Williamhamiltonella defendens]|uniref:Conjugal transfer protein n=1 Tax=Candidatus Williamhamiltonella defendens TaxID=138072 RepID=A0A2D3TGQ1_9ENTR|nr:VirB10/TraB/TrbI family type IV secretion system protein [Candidatus Hamiltonella defensa]ATW34844.1 conjugal transfer protein [Candidatus Hamiltonella defensa]